MTESELRAAARAYLDTKDERSALVSLVLAALLRLAKDEGSREGMRVILGHIGCPRVAAVSADAHGSLHVEEKT